MEFKNKSLIDAIESVVTSMQVNGEPYFRYGNIKEIGDLLMDIDKSGNGFKFKKYPLIILKLDVTSEFDKKTRDFIYRNITIYIVNYTEAHYDAAKRKTESFEKVLIPIYEQFITAIKKNGNIINKDNIPFIEHSKTDRYFWGSSLNKNNTKNLMGDYLDAIEIGNLTLKINNKNC